MPSYDISRTFISYSRNRFSDIINPTPPDPCRAFGSRANLFWPYHLYPGTLMPFWSLWWVSQSAYTSCPALLITVLRNFADSLSCLWYAQPFTFHWAKVKTALGWLWSYCWPVAGTSGPAGAWALCPGCALSTSQPQRISRDRLSRANRRTYLLWAIKLDVYPRLSLTILKCALVLHDLSDSILRGQCHGHYPWLTASFLIAYALCHRDLHGDLELIQ